MKTQELIAAGVKIDRPETCVIDPEVEVGAETIIEPFVQLLGTHAHRHGLPHPLLLRDRELHSRQRRSHPPELRA